MCHAGFRDCRRMCKAPRYSCALLSSLRSHRRGQRWGIGLMVPAHACPRVSTRLQQGLTPDVAGRQRHHHRRTGPMARLSSSVEGLHLSRPFDDGPDLSPVSGDFKAAAPAYHSSSMAGSASGLAPYQGLRIFPVPKGIRLHGLRWYSEQFVPRLSEVSVVKVEQTTSSCSVAGHSVRSFSAF